MMTAPDGTFALDMTAGGRPPSWSSSRCGVEGGSTGAPFSWAWSGFTFVAMIEMSATRARRILCISSALLYSDALAALSANSQEETGAGAQGDVEGQPFRGGRAERTIGFADRVAHLGHRGE